MGNAESIQMLEKIRSDSYGDVYKAKWRGQLVAARRFNPSLVRHKNEIQGGLMAEILEELKISQELRHENIVETLHVMHKEGDSPVLITELLDSSLSARIETSQYDPNISALDINTIMLGVARGMEYLHNQVKPVVHGDITTKNILLNTKKQAKLANVGLARVATDYLSRMPDRTQAYKTLEVETQDINKTSECGTEIDICGFGESLLEAVLGHPLQKVFNPLSYDPGSSCVKHQRDLQEIEEDYPLRGLVLSCLEENPQNRPSATGIVHQLQSQELRTAMMKFELRKGIVRVEKEFLDWIPIRRRTILELEELQLDQMASQLDDHHRNINIATAAAASTSLVATGMVVGGFIASFFTAGAALPVAITGGVLGAAGGLTTFGSKIVDIVLSKIANGKITDALEEDKAASTRLRKQLDVLDCVIVENVQNALRKINTVEQEEPTALIKEELKKTIEDATGFSVPDGAKHLYPGGTRAFGAVLGVAASSTTAGVEVVRTSAVAFDALSTAARATHVAGFVLSVISLPFDIYFLAKSSKELKNQSPSEVAEVLRGIPGRLVCPDESQVPELVHEYVGHQTSEALQGIIEKDDNDDDVSFVNATLHLDDDTI